VTLFVYDSQHICVQFGGRSDYCVNQRVCRLICEALLSSDKLSYQNTELWCMTLALVRRIIGGVDYKVSYY